MFIDCFGGYSSCVFTTPGASLGAPGNSVVGEAVDLHTRELSLLVLLAALILLLGLWPGSVLEVTRLASEGWVEHLRPVNALP